MALDIAVGLKSPANSQKAAADMNGDGLINISDVGAILDMAVNLKDTGAGVVRDASVSNPLTTQTFSVSSGTDLNLNAYILGDVDGTYATIL